MTERSAKKLLGKKGVPFERAVAAVQSMMDPQATVTHDEKIRDRHGQLRQFDVVIRAKAGGHEILGVIECKDWRKRVGIQEIDAFVSKSQSVNASITLLASRSGFTKPALEKAKYYGIGTISLLLGDPQDCGFSVGMQWYAEIYYWAKVKFSINFVRKHSLPAQINSYQVTWCGWPVIDWFHKELATTYLKEQGQGVFSLKLVFDKPRRFHLASAIYLVRGVTFYALRACKQKTKWIQVYGEGFFDWNRKKVTMPPGKQILTDWFRGDFSDWQDCHGEIPPSSGLLDMRFTAYKRPFDPKKKVVDLSKLSRDPLIGEWHNIPWPPNL